MIQRPASPEEEKEISELYDLFSRFYHKLVDGVRVADVDSSGTITVIVDNGTWDQHSIYIHQSVISCDSLSRSPFEYARAAAERLKERERLNLILYGTPGENPPKGIIKAK